MANLVKCTSVSHLKVEETLDLALDMVVNPVIPHLISGNSTADIINATSTVPATKCYSDEITLTSGTHTLDLTALLGPTVNGTAAPIDFTGLKVQAVEIKAKTTNTESLTIEVGATNPYHIFGSADGEITLDAGDRALFTFQDILPDVASGAKDIDISSSDLDAKFEIILVAG